MTLQFEKIYNDIFDCHTIQVSYLQGMKDNAFGKQYEAAFFPFLNSQDNMGGIYYIYTTGKLYLRYNAGGILKTKRFFEFREYELMVKLREIIKNVFETKKGGSYISPGKMPRVEVRKELKTPSKKAIKKEPQKLDLIKDRYLTLKGNRGRLAQSLPFLFRTKQINEVNPPAKNVVVKGTELQANNQPQFVPIPSVEQLMVIETKQPGNVAKTDYNHPAILSYNIL